MDGFEPSELTVTTGTGANAPSSWSSGSDGDTTYTGTINTSGVSSSADSVDVTISVNSNRAEDAAENGNSASRSSVDKTVMVDKKKPTPTIAAVSGTQSGRFTITIDFDENVSNFGLSDISLSTQSGDAAGTASHIDSSNGDKYTARITPSGTGTLRISVSAGAAQDDAGNASVASMNVDVSVDTEGPTPTITAPMDTQNGPFDVTIDFGEDVMGFAVGDLDVMGATKASNWQSGKSGPAEYTITLTPTTANGSTGTVTIDVAADVATDGANGNEAASQVTVNIDRDAPTLTIDAPTMDQNGPFDVTFTFDQDVINFEPSDVTVTDANKAGSWKSGASGPREYTIILTPAGIADGSTGTVTIDVAADAAEDAANNGNEAATQASVTVDKKAPTVTISDVPSDAQNDEFTLTIMFDEDVTDFMTDDLRIQPSSRATATAVAAVSGSESQYTATITPNANQDGNVTVRVKADAATDEAGNKSPLSAVTSAIHIDTIAPTATISGLPTGEANSFFPVTITFNEDVTGFAEADLTVTGEATVNGVTRMSGSMYTADISPTDNKEGEVTVQVRVNAVTDAAGNSNPASTATPNIHIDTIEPTGMFVNVPTTPQKDPFDVTLRFSERVSGFDLMDDTSVEHIKSMTVALKSSSANGRDYVLTVTPEPVTSGATDFIGINQNAVQDNAGNRNAAFASGYIPIDTIVPTVSISGEPSGSQKDLFDLTITFSEDVTGLCGERSDIHTHRSCDGDGGDGVDGSTRG